MPKPSKVTYIGALTFHVLSDDPARAIKEDGKGFYVCDLTSKDGQGQCDCRNHRITRRDNGGNCKHLMACRDFVAQRVIDHFIKTYGPTQDT